MKLIKLFFRFVRYLFLIIICAMIAVGIIAFAPPIWRHLIIYPRLQKESVQFQKLRKEPSVEFNLKTFRGVLHGHSFWSHDSRGTLYDLVSAAEKTGTVFIFLSDHPHGNSDTIPRGIKGFFNGILIEPGSEKKGLNVWPLDSMVIDWREDTDTIVSHLIKRGGLVLYSHPEQPHNYRNQLFHGMEIYNFHADTEDEPLYPQILNFIVNGKKYDRWTYRQMFDEQSRMIALWDSLNCHRRVVGYAAIDTHENQNIRARYLSDKKVEWIGPNAKVIDTMDVRWWNRWLFSKPDPDGWIFRLMIDTYETGFGFVTNYLLADTLSAVSIAENVKKGHLFVAFNSLADAAGFNYYAVGSSGGIAGIMGDSVRANQVKEIRAVSPFPGQARLFHNGKTIEVTNADVYEYSFKGPLEKGAYRIELQLKLRGKYIPWLYSNPIYVY